MVEQQVLEQQVLQMVEQQVLEQAQKKTMKMGHGNLPQKMGRDYY